MRQEYLEQARGFWIAGLFLVSSLCVVGYGAFAWASTNVGPLQIEQDQVTGRVTELPLQQILDQLKTQLGITYQAPQAALAQPVSVSLHHASLKEALAKVLAKWDYALQADPKGNIQHIFIVSKIPAGGDEEQAIDAENERAEFSSAVEENKRIQEVREASAGIQQAADKYPSSTTKSATPNSSQSFSPNDWEQGNGIEAAGMEIIPGSGFPEMDVTPLSDAEQQTILQSLNPPDLGSSDGAGLRKMEITPVSEADAQAILESLNQSIGRSSTGPLP